MIQRRKPLRRSTKPLRRTNALKTKAIIKRTKPLKSVGKRAKRRAPFMARCREAVMYRAAVILIPLDGTPVYVKCEECQRNISAQEAEWHHVFGRSLGIAHGGNWCHVKELTLALCRACHERLTNPVTDNDLAAVMRTNFLAALRFGQRFGIQRESALRTFITSTPRAFVVQLAQSAGGQPTEP